MALEPLRVPIAPDGELANSLKDASVTASPLLVDTGEAIYRLIVESETPVSGVHKGRKRAVRKGQPLTQDDPLFRLRSSSVGPFSTLPDIWPS
ncbi:MAG: hypothetical protein ACR2PL_02240 [Dehalococcoidia bacterium]